MSAIFGLLHFDDRPVNAADLARMGAALHVHGAEGGGLWQHGPVGLGQRQAMVTPQDRYERQPVVSADGQRRLVVNGRLDNRPELLAQFGADGPAARITDSALILNAYERWGEACVQHLIGVFTFALWDAHTQTLLAVRSACSSPSLYFYADRDTVAFASMPKGLFALADIPRKIDRQYLAEYLARIGGEPDACLYQGLTRLIPGQMLRIRRDDWSLHTFWGDAPPKDEIHFARDEEYVAAFLALFQRVIQDHLRCLTPVGVMMSGGLDSTSVAALAAPLYREMGWQLATFTEAPRIGFDGAIIAGRYADETPYVEAMARRYENLEANLMRTDGQVYIEHLDAYFAAAETPFPNASNRVWYEAILQAAQTRGLRVLLTGDSGNLTISWNGNGLWAQLIGAGEWARLSSEALALARGKGMATALKTVLTQGFLPHLPAAAYLALERVQNLNANSLGSRADWRQHSPIRPEFAAAHDIDELFLARERHLLGRPSSDTRTVRLRALVSKSRRGDGISEGYQARYGVTIADPTGDVRLINFCLALPESQYQRNGVSRWLLRRAMADRLPPEVLANRQRGLQAADWYDRLVGARSALLEELTRIEQCELAQQALDLPRLRGLVMQLGRDNANRAGRQFAQYRGVLERGLMTGSFIRWVEENR